MQGMPISGLLKLRLKFITFIQLPCSDGVIQAIVKTFELADVPVRAGRFIARKNWIVCGSDDFQLRVYNYNTSEKITSFEAHPDYIRSIVVHPTQPFVLT